MVAYWLTIDGSDLNAQLQVAILGQLCIWAFEFIHDVEYVFASTCYARPSVVTSNLASTIKLLSDAINESAGCKRRDTGQVNQGVLKLSSNCNMRRFQNSTVS